MTIFTFTGLQLRNADNSIAPNATAQIFARGDTSFSTPLEPLDMSETTVLPGVTSDWNGDVPPFKVDTDVAAVVAYAEGYQARPIASVDELVDGVAVAVAAATEVHGLATQARDTAVTAASSAAGAEAAAVALAPDGGAKAVGKGELVVNVRDFGAVGDGVADDTSAFNAWLDHLIANQDAEGFIPPGIWRVTSSLVRTDVPVGVVMRGAGARYTFLYGDFVSPGEGILGFIGTNHTTGQHEIRGVGFLGNGVPGDPVGLVLEDAWECVVEDIDAPYGVNGPWNLANSVVVVTNDNNSKFRNIRGQAGWQPAAFSIPTSTRASFTSGSPTITATTGIFTAAMVGESIYFASGSDTGTHAIWRANIISVAGDGFSCTIDTNAPTTASDVQFKVGYILGTVASGSTSLELSNVVGLTTAYVGMQVHVLGADAKPDSGNVPGVLSTHITAVSGNTITLAAAASISVTDAVVLFAPNVFIGAYKDRPNSSQQVNHSWWHDVHCEGFRAAGLIVNRAVYLTINNLKIHGAGYGGSSKWGECYYWAVFSEIKSADIRGIQGAFGVRPSPVHVSGSRGILSLDNFEIGHLYKDAPAIEAVGVTAEFRLSLGDSLITHAITAFASDWRPVAAPYPQSVEYKGTITHRNKAGTLGKSGGMVRRGITGTHGAVTIADDTVFRFKPEGTFGLLHIASGNAGVGGIYWYRTSDHAAGASLVALVNYPSGAMNVIGTATTLTGTTNPDSLVTLAPDAGGSIQIQNRRSFAITVTVLCAPYGS